MTAFLLVREFPQSLLQHWDIAAVPCATSVSNVHIVAQIPTIEHRASVVCVHGSLLDHVHKGSMLPNLYAQVHSVYVLQDQVLLPGCPVMHG